MELNLYQYQSSKWDMDISLKELLKNNEYCKIDRNYKAHKYDDCFHGYCIYLKYPKKNEYEVMVGIFEDGFTYLGDSGEIDLPLVKTIDAVEEMYLHGENIKIKDYNLKESNKMEINSEKIINMLSEKYFSEAIQKCKDEQYAIFQIIMNQYKENSICPICDSKKENQYDRGHYNYNECRVFCNDSHFGILNSPFSLIIQANYCPVCGRELK